MTIDTLFENEHILAINKPAGMAVHEDDHSTDATVVDWVRSAHPELEGVGEPMTLQSGRVIERPGVVHRLDRDTSGVLVLAKDQETFLFLKDQFKSRKIEKLYHAFLWGELKELHGTVDKPIGRSRRDFRLWSAATDAGGKMRAATTRYTTLCTGNGFSYVALEPKTGRTHQIRVHMKVIGHPVVCDTRYGAKKGCGLGFERLALHSRELTLTLPTGERLALEAPLPEDFVRAERLLVEDIA